ncbi:MAG: DUF4974 domain-containing protein [Niabella sp.]
MGKRLEERFFILFARKLSGDASSDELKEIEAILELYPELQFFYNELIKSGQYEMMDVEKAEQSFISDVMNMQLRGVWDNEGALQVKRTRNKFAKRFYGVAIIAAIAFIIGVVLIVKVTKEKVSSLINNEMSTARGTKSYTVLPDGTQVWLNSETELSYAKSFGSATREVTLSGEAYFDVVKDSLKPFIVHTKTVDIKVIGTAFNISAYEGDKLTEATLIRGSVEVDLKKYHGRKIVLKPFEKVSVENVSNKIVKKEVVPVQEEQTFALNKNKKVSYDAGSTETQWVKNRLVFTDNTLEEIAGRLARWYNVDIVIANEELKQTKYNAVFDDVTLEQVMQSLKLTGRFNYNIDNRHVTISP